MQHTEKYKLNLIETSDTFSPDALNENMEKVEAAITAEADALDQRLQVFEAKHIAIGSYFPDKSVDVDLGFWPVCVIIHAMGANSSSGILFRDYNHPNGEITPNGFHITPGMPNSIIGYSACRYGYIAFD